MLRRSKQAPAAAVPAIVTPPVLSPEIQQAARVEAELADARRDHAAALAEADAARAAYEAAADAGRLSEAVAARTRIREAETAADIAVRIVRRLDAELQELLDGAADAAAAAEREQLRTAAHMAAAAYQAEFRASMPEITSQLRGLIRLHALAEVAREAAAAAGAHLPRADAFRDIAGTPRQEIGREERDLWLNPYGGMPYGDADQAQIRTDHNGGGVLQGHNHTHRPTQKRRYADITYRPATPGALAPALSEALVLPCLDAGASAGWSPLKAGTSPRAVLEALDALEARQDTPRPELRTERQPIEPARDVRISQDPAPFREYRGPYGSMDDVSADERASN